MNFFCVAKYSGWQHLVYMCDVLSITSLDLYPNKQLMMNIHVWCTLFIDKLGSIAQQILYTLDYASCCILYTQTLKEKKKDLWKDSDLNVYIITQDKDGSDV